MAGLEEQFFQNVRQFHMLQPEDPVIAAVSGGADSVCLLMLLCAFREKYGLKLRAVHVHHGLRGAEADRDAAFTRELCGRLQVPCQVIYVSVKAFQKEQGLSQEEAARQLRYEQMEEAAAAWESEEKLTSPVKIGVAHHRMDQAETILHNLFRGSGLRGMGGIRPVRDRIVRPLLNIDQQEILRWLEEKGQDFCIDSTNASNHYTRNRIRREIIPAVCSLVNPQAVSNIVHLGQLSDWADEYLESQARHWNQENLRHRPEGVLIPEKLFGQLPQILKAYCLFALLRESAGQGRDLTFQHQEQLQALFEKKAGSILNLPYGLRAVKEYEGVLLKSGKEQATSAFPCLKTEIFSYKKGTEIPKNQYTKWFDCDKIKDTPIMRNRRSGDYIMLADGKRKTIQRFMIDEKIPREKRDQIPLLADGDHIMWIVGSRISEYYKIGPDTRTVFQARIEESYKGESMAEKIRVLITKEEVDSRIEEIASQINADYRGKQLHLICVLKGGVFFTCELAKRLNMPVTMDFMSVSSYGAGTTSSGEVKIIKDLDEPLDGKEVLIVEDIIDSGRTLAYLIELLRERHPADIRLCTLLDKPDRRVKKQVTVDYTCFSIPDEFVVGYGLDYDQRYRNLPYIGVVEFEQS